VKDVTPPPRPLTPGTGSVFQVDDLSVGYVRSDGEENIVVWKASFALEPRMILGLAGESGCGKSTTALASIGYRAPGSRILNGSAQLDGLDLLSLPSGKLREVWGCRVAYVAQNATTALNPAIPIGRQLAQPLARHMGLRRTALREREVELLEAVGIPNPAGALERYPHQFSGGQQQRIAIAIALSCNPQVLILDEPTTGLDVTTQARISALIRSLIAETGAATLYVSHDLSLLGTVADRLAVMYAGEIIEEGDAQGVVRRPRHPYTQALLAAVPTAHTRSSVAGIPGRPPASVVLDACSFAPRCPYVIDACRRGYVELREIAEGHRARCIRADEIAARPADAAPLPVPAVVPEPLLEVDEVWSQYARSPTPAVRGVSFTVAGGETLGIVGESGSGKSTILRTIVGLHPPTAGTIRLRGQPLAPSAVKRPRSVRRELQIVFQNPDSSLNPRHSVFEIVRRPIRLFRDDIPRSGERAAVAELLESVKLPTGLLHRYATELSGGQKQRVALARAFAPRPSVLLCDEVTSALDVSVQATIIELIAELAARFGTAVVFVSHDLAVVRTIAGRAIVMRNGEICEEGETERLFLSPKHPYTQELLAAIPELDTAAAPAA
jgi:peptide/nickel transport system ATP-binding protein